jgi:DNA polymerase III epsilon subunit-like protein
MKRYCVIDTETGGIGAEAAQRWSIIQLGACIYYEGPLPGVGQSFECVIKEPTLHLDPEAMAINKFTVERIETEGISPAMAAVRFTIWLYENFPDLAKGERVMLMGHNIGYDVSFLQRLFRLAGVLDAYNTIFNYRTIDTPSIKRFLVEAGYAKEGELELEPTTPHDALSDAIATGKLYQKMQRLVRMACMMPASSDRNPYHFDKLTKRY